MKTYFFPAVGGLSEALSTSFLFFLFFCKGSNVFHCVYSRYHKMTHLNDNILKFIAVSTVLNWKELMHTNYIYRKKIKHLSQHFGTKPSSTFTVFLSYIRSVLMVFICRVMESALMFVRGLYKSRSTD